MLRGRELRDAFIMRFFALERVIRGLVIATRRTACGGSPRTGAPSRRIFEKDIPLLKPLADQFGWDLDHSHIVETIRHVFTLKSSTLIWFAVGLLAYALVELIEAVGLWMLKRWGEYFAVVATSCGLPFEIYELTERITVLPRRRPDHQCRPGRVPSRVQAAVRHPRRQGGVRSAAARRVVDRGRAGRVFGRTPKPPGDFCRFWGIAV